MRLQIITPLAVLVDEDIECLNARDASGSFGILPRHAPFLTALEISISSWKRAGREQYCALRGGVLTVSGHEGNRAQNGTGTSLTGGTVVIATREAILGDDLATLDRDVLARFRDEAEAERVEHSDAVQLQLNAIRQMVSRLQPKQGGNFR